LNTSTGAFGGFTKMGKLFAAASAGAVNAVREGVVENAVTGFDGYASGVTERIVSNTSIGASAGFTKMGKLFAAAGAVVYVVGEVVMDNAVTVVAVYAVYVTEPIVIEVVVSYSIAISEGVEMSVAEN
tara:strand:- start:1364 stop:1747 length:384 start_codon:yes stop_codon:yes gene_type:complete